MDSTVQQCSWNKPGVNPYTGNVGDAIHRFKDVPLYIREKLTDRVFLTPPDDRVFITRDFIRGKYEYGGLRDMHFGKATVCRWPEYSGWSKRHAEPARVYCESGYCILIPDICQNTSQVTMLGPAPKMPTQTVPEPSTSVLILGTVLALAIGRMFKRSA